MTTAKKPETATTKMTWFFLEHIIWFFSKDNGWISDRMLPLAHKVKTCSDHPHTALSQPSYWRWLVEGIMGTQQSQELVGRTWCHTGLFTHYSKSHWKMLKSQNTRSAPKILIRKRSSLWETMPRWMQSPWEIRKREVRAVVMWMFIFLKTHWNT